MSRLCSPRTAQQPPARAGVLWLRSPRVRPQRSRNTASRSGPLTKEPSLPRVERALLSSGTSLHNFFGAALVFGLRGLGHADLAWAQRWRDRRAQGTISESAYSPATPPLCLPLPPRDASAGRDTGGPRNSVCVCPRAPAPPPAGALSTSNPGRRPPRAGRFQLLLLRINPLPSSPSTPNLLRSSRATSKMFSATQGLGRRN